MGYRFHGRARINPSSPRAVCRCDRCDFVYNREDLRPQMEWAGNSIIDTGFRVCSVCMLDPSPALKTTYVPPDPPPLLDQWSNGLSSSSYSIDEFETMDGEQLVTTEDDDLIADIPNPG